MKNKDKWFFTKLIIHPTTNKPEPNLHNIYGGSYYITKIQIPLYHKILGKYAKGHILDAGCGDVPYYESYRNVVDNITCTDLRTNMYVDQIVNLNEKFPFADNSFDTILLADVINHVSNTQNLISEIKRVLKNDGRVIIFTPFLYWINEAPFDFYRFSAHGLRSLFDPNSFREIVTLQYGSWWDVFMDVLNKKFSSGNKFRVFKRFCDMSVFIRKPYISKRLTSYPLGFIFVTDKVQ